MAHQHNNQGHSIQAHQIGTESDAMNSKTNSNNNSRPNANSEPHQSSGNSNGLHIATNYGSQVGTSMPPYGMNYLQSPTYPPTYGSGYMSNSIWIDSQSPKLPSAHGTWPHPYHMPHQGLLSPVSTSNNTNCQLANGQYFQTLQPQQQQSFTSRQDLDFYHNRADMIGDMHGLQIVGYLGDALQPLGWQKGQPPISIGAIRADFGLWSGVLNNVFNIGRAHMQQLPAAHRSHAMQVLTFTNQLLLKFVDVVRMERSNVLREWMNSQPGVSVQMLPPASRASTHHPGAFVLDPYPFVPASGQVNGYAHSSGAVGSGENQLPLPASRSSKLAKKSASPVKPTKTNKEKLIADNQDGANNDENEEDHDNDEDDQDNAPKSRYEGPNLFKGLDLTKDINELYRDLDARMGPLPSWEPNPRLLAEALEHSRKERAAQAQKKANSKNKSKAITHAVPPKEQESPKRDRSLSPPKSSPAKRNRKDRNKNVPAADQGFPLSAKAFKALTDAGVPVVDRTDAATQV